MATEYPKKTIDVSKIVPPKTIPQIKPKKYIDDFIFNSLGKIFINSNTSCDKDEAVAKMLGWLKGSLRIHPDDIDLRNISLAQMPYLPTLEYALDDYLEMLLEKASENMIAALNDPSASEIIREKTSEVFVNCEKLTSKALAYKCAIEAELAKQNESALKIDFQRTQTENEIFITLDSLHKWAKEQFKLSILDEANNTETQNRGAIVMPKRIDYLCAELLEILPDMDNPSPEKVMKALKQRVGVKGSRIVGDIGYGIKWENSNHEEVELNMKALRRRLNQLIKT